MAFWDRKNSSVQETYFLQVLMRHLPDKIYFKDRESRFLCINQELAKMFGLRDPIEAVGKTDADFFSAEHAGRAREDELAILNSSQAIVDREEKETWPDGHTTWASTAKLPLRDGKGEIIGTFGLSRDITAHKKAELEKKQLEEQLLQIRKLEAIGRLASGVAHDFNNLLTVIMGRLQMASRRPSQAHAQPDLDTALQACQRASDLTQQLLAYGRQQKATFGEVDMNQLVRGMLLTLRSYAGEAVELQTELDPGLWTAWFETGQAEQILLNLVANARDALPDRRGRIQIRTGNVERRMGEPPYPALAGGQFVMIQVIDNGAGMPPEVTEKLFEPFFTTKELGHGLGLASAYGMLQDAGGSIRAVSAPGQGTCIEVLLPRMSQPERAQAQAT